MEGVSKQELLEVLQQGGTTTAAPSAAAAEAAHTQHQQLEQHESDRDSWKDLYRVLITSLQQSSAQFQALTFEALTLGLWGISSAHAELRDDIQGRALGLQDRAVIKEFIYFAEWARAFEAGSTVQQLAQALCIPEAAVVWHQPLSLPRRPAHLVAVDHLRKQLLLVVRGTSQLADVLADLVAHTSPLGPGQAHSGMLDCAAAIIQQCLPTLEQQLQQNPGYRVHCLGHSLGGGVAALAAYLLRNTAELRGKLTQASGVVATGFGTPPIMTKELADKASGYTRTLVHNHDLVPRTCVASLAELRRELEQQKEAVFANNTTMAWLRDSGVLQGGKALVASLCTYSAANAVS
ncbi:Alpha/Beta hydrolase protein [Scenedesmus sp. NREL 46B-D3]|nr:Alpha/Beta hydrolase protein [Scenedesmus sp. NREL 46B-D3]